MATRAQAVPPLGRRITLGTARWVSALGLLALGCLAGFLLERSVRKSPSSSAASSATVRMVAAQPLHGTRIWYPPGSNLDLVARGGRRYAIRSVLNISKPMRFGTYVWNEDRVPPGPVWLRIDLTNQILSAFRGGHEIASTVILYGAQDRPTPLGTFTILDKAVYHFSHTYHAPMPYMLRLTNDGVAVHGSVVREGWATHGCIGVPLDFARRLFAITRRGDTVEIMKTELTGRGGQVGFDSKLPAPFKWRLTRSLHEIETRK